MTNKPMRVLLATVGTRGDVQPMLALALALRDAGHQPVLAAPAFAADEAAAFGVPFAPVGLDIKRVLEERKAHMNGPMSFVREAMAAFRADARKQVEGLVPLAADADVVVGAGITLAAATAAEHAGVPFRFVCFAPEMAPSAFHPPAILPFPRLPQLLKRALWRVMGAMFDRMLRPSLNTARRALALPDVTDIMEHGRRLGGRMLLAADPEIAPPKPDQDVEVLGSFALPDERPLPSELHAFIAAGAKPVYIGFGSMADATPHDTARLVATAGRLAGCRIILSAGWAGLGGSDLGDHVQLVGPVSHGRLFPQLAAAVHHGGAGTTAAAARAGIPQLLVPHIADQFGFGRAIHERRLGPQPLPRSKLTVENLAERLTRLISNDVTRDNASVAGESIRARAPLAAAVHLLEAAVAGQR